MLAYKIKVEDHELGYVKRKKSSCKSEKLVLDQKWYNWIWTIL